MGPDDTEVTVDVDISRMPEWVFEKIASAEICGASGEYQCEYNYLAKQQEKADLRRKQQEEKWEREGKKYREDQKVCLEKWNIWKKWEEQDNKCKSIWRYIFGCKDQGPEPEKPDHSFTGPCYQYMEMHAFPPRGDIGDNVLPPSITVRRIVQ